MFSGAHATNVAALVGAASGTPATFIAADKLHVTSATTFDAALPTTGTGGAVADGDILLVWYCNGASGSEALVAKQSGAAFTQLDYDYAPSSIFYSAWYRVLTSAERANGFITITGGDTGNQLNMAFYRGATTAAKKSHVAWSSSSQAITGFTPAGNSAGVVFLVVNVDSGAATPAATGWVVDADMQVWGGRGYAISRLSGYAGASDTFSNFTGTSEKAGILVELLR